MLKFNMEFVDVVFPLNLGPLTYKCPEHLRCKAFPGMLVSAPLKNQTTLGIILDRYSQLPLSMPHALRYIIDIHGESPLFDQPVLKLLNWMSDYYLANKGLVLKNMLPKEAFKKVKASAKKLSAISYQLSGQRLKQISKGDETILSKINESILKKEYRTFLFHAPTSSYEIAFLIELLRSQQPIMILVPEIANINNIAHFIREAAGEKLCIVHSGLNRGQRSGAYEKIISGKCSVVLGTRMAVFAPLKNTSLIIIMQEHSSSYKTEEGMRFNARDIAVMRGYLEKATVVLSSICPSIESFYNAKQNKYTLLMPDTAIQRPKIKIINMYQEKQPNPNLSKTVISAAQSFINKNEKIMFVINRKGYSMLTCKECGYIETCDRCRIPLVFHKDDKSLRCHYCGFRSFSPEKCRRCRSFEIELIGSGIQRIEENVKRILNLEPVRLDSDRIKRKTRSEELSEIINGETVIIGTKLLTRRVQRSEEFSMAAVLNADMYLNLPDFRSAERAYQELTSIADKLKPEGILFVQTKMPQNYLFKFLKSYDYHGFYHEELTRRKAMSYPPYSKIALMSFKGKDYNEDKVNEFIRKNSNKDLEILGPSTLLSRKGEKGYSMLLKTTSKQKLHSNIKELLKIFEGYKDLTINVAIDP